jgi:hypothetical protein
MGFQGDDQVGDELSGFRGNLLVSKKDLLLPNHKDYITECINDMIRISTGPTCVSYEYDPTPTAEELLKSLTIRLEKLKQYIELNSI